MFTLNKEHIHNLSVTIVSLSMSTFILVQNNVRGKHSWIYSTQNTVQKQTKYV